MKNICLFIFFIPVITAIDTKQCDNGYFYKDNILCEDCMVFCSNLNSLNPEQKAICSPFCSKSTTIRTITSTYNPVTSKEGGYVYQTPLPNTSSLTYAVLIIPIIIVIIIIVLGVVFKKDIKRKCAGGRTNNNRAEYNKGTGLSGVIVVGPGNDQSNALLIINDRREPHIDLDEDRRVSVPATIEEYCASPQLESLAPTSIYPDHNDNRPGDSIQPPTMDPRPIPRDFAISRNPVLIQSIMMQTRYDEAPSELIQTPKKKQNIKFDDSKNTFDVPAQSIDGSGYPSEDSSTTKGRYSDQDENFDSIYPEDPPSPQTPSPEYGSGNSRTIMNHKYQPIKDDDEDDPRRYPLRRDDSNESTGACILPSIIPSESMQISESITDSDDHSSIPNPFAKLPLAPVEDRKKLQEKNENALENDNSFAELPIATDPFAGLPRAPPDSPVKDGSFFSTNIGK